MRSRLFQIGGFRVALLLLAVLGSVARADTEFEVKAAYLVNFAKLVEWPASAFPAGKGTLIVGVVGRGGVSEELGLAVSGASVGGRAIQVRHVSAADGAALAACHVVFVTEAERVEIVVAAVQGRPVLVVGESEDFVRRGGAIGFVKDGGTVKFEANPKAADRNGLSISAKLLRVARSVVDR